ncbi:putative tubulin-specific chaperone [Aspergillus clavatus NRRL 1]|uniref:Tubulin-specific chaperone E n=1 Tax=Aspergillus clavatus (strain ATCC 1007 / CBS 513.65 / DSM 816 / NCTC 3887 / NRRL 1 / QM 1276 / 107) TaxID=344612 RepID=A1CIB4_ASPCL|nr:tubulin-specific chaperone, putative [Aspergillus clavatus NRRL 1]EAW10619.1 tubulin-specific chaperone, putative [Aspergillus clavatus NRRL 1]
MDSEGYVNQRRSYNGDLCTVRYVGKVEGTIGEWLGVEWDDPTRGKHSGEHNGVRYFTCRSKHPTAGSFVRPSRRSEQPRGFIEALRQKYASEFEEELARQKQGDLAAADGLRDAIKFSGKVVEEVGFDKIRKKLAELQELKIVLLDGLRVGGILAHAAGPEERMEACRDIETTCSKIVELDLSYNLLERWTEIADICHCLKRLRKLKLIGNRLGPLEEGLTFDGITQLHLDETLLSWDEISALTYQFTSLTALSASANQITEISAPITGTITTLILENNDIFSLVSLERLTSLDKLEHLSLRENRIDKVYGRDSEVNPIQFSQSLKSVDLSRNIIDSWSLVDELQSIFPGLQSLRISGNPLYDKPVAPSTATGLPEKPMTVDEAYMLTLARLSSIQTLNYSKITPQDRSNGEMYYLSLIGKELSAYPESAEREILGTHPRYHELCEKYGPPTIRRASESAGAAVNPRSVAARLVKLIFHLNPSGGSEAREQQIKSEKIPRSFDTYQVKAIASRLFNLPPYQCRLVWETDELDPVSQEKKQDEDDWDSDDDVSNKTLEDNSKLVDLSEEAKFVKREIELVDSTRDIGFWFQPDILEARIRIEVAS